MLPANIKKKLNEGTVIPAHPLALNKNLKLDEKHQRALTRYYLSAGAGGLAVGVHTTQFEIHNPKVGLYKPVLELAINTVNSWNDKKDPIILIAGIVGPTKQATKEAKIAKSLGYHIGLVSLTALRGKPIPKLIEHIKAISQIIPVMGFYLQETISKMRLPIDFWHQFAKLDSAVAIKIAPFNRYQTLDVVRGLALTGRKDIALYTGNDDSIVTDLLTEFVFNINGKPHRYQIVGGLLGQWAVWTRQAVRLLNKIKLIRKQNRKTIPKNLLTLASQITYANQVIFDADNNFIGCIPGILYVLKKSGLIKTIKLLNTREKLSPNQAKHIDQIIKNYPHLTDEKFIKENLHRWLR